MKIVFWKSCSIDSLLATSFAKGIEASGFGDEFEISDISNDVTGSLGDVGILFGLGEYQCSIANKYWTHKIPLFWFDKGYTRKSTTLGGVKYSLYYRVSCNYHIPMLSNPYEIPRENKQYLEEKVKRFGWNNPKPTSIVESKKNILFCPPSPMLMKTNKWNWEDTVLYFLEHLRRNIQDLPILFRFKPSQIGHFTREQKNSLKDISNLVVDSSGKNPDRSLNSSRFLVTWSSCITIEAVMRGIPVFTVWPNVADPVASGFWVDSIRKPNIPTSKQVSNWTRSLAATQFGVEEIQNGTAWRALRKILT